MVKLTTVQQKLIDDAKAKIDFARTHTLREWVINNFGYGGTEESIEQSARWRDEHWGNNAGDIVRDSLKKAIAYYEAEPEQYNEERNGIIKWTYNNSNTLRALEKKGVIEIIEDGGACSDAFRVLNY